MKKAYFIALLAVVMGSAAQAQEWYDSMKIKGDVRYRYENIDDETKPDTQERDRIRLRAGVYAKANPDVDVGLRLTTSSFENGGGSGDPISGNQTLNGGGSKKGIYLDAAYFDYHPNQIKGLDFIAGKMDNPIYMVADNVWDKDYTPEGAAVKYKIGDELQFMANGAYHWLEERPAGDDAKQLIGQGLVRYGKDDDNYSLFGVTYSTTDGLEGNNVIDNTAAKRSFGNTTVKKVNSAGTTNSLYASEFDVVEGFVEFGTSALGGIPARAYASYTVNNEADDNDTGYIAGVQYGRAKDAGTFEVGYNYRDLEKDAVLGCLTDSDAGGGGTNYKGHKLHAGYAFMKNWALNLAYFIDKKDPDGKDTDYNRLQIDLNAKF